MCNYIILLKGTEIVYKFIRYRKIYIMKLYLIVLTFLMEYISIKKKTK